MALRGKLEKIKQEDGTEKEEFSVIFTNATYEQLKELRSFLERD